VTGTDHRDLDGDVEEVECVGWDATGLVAQDHDGPATGRRQIGESDRLVRQFHPHDL
jgi:hypothetical protein